MTRFHEIDSASLIQALKAKPEEEMPSKAFCAAVAVAVAFVIAALPFWLGGL